MTDEDKFEVRAQRMLTRWAGQRMPVSRRQTAEGEVLRQAPPSVGALDAALQVYHEPAKALPVLTSCDVLVVGAGPAGISAALAARRAGADTVLLERFGCLGGVITTVGMETLASKWSALPRKWAARSNGRTTTANAWMRIFLRW